MTGPAVTAPLHDAVDLDGIAARAMGLDARCDPATELTAVDRARGIRRLETWRRACAERDDAAFARRLAWDGWTRETLVERLGGTPVAPAALPSWTRTLSLALDRGRAVAAELEATGRVAEESLFPEGRALPFLHLWTGFSREADDRLSHRVGSTFERLAPGARDDLRRRLANDLVLWSAAALLPELRRSLARQGRRPDPARNDGYLRFVLDGLRGDLGRFLTARPTLARRLAILADTWVETTAELVERLDRDLPRMERRLPGDGSPGPVTSIRTALSDRHRGGRQVASLRFASGAEVVYKPRPVDLEVVWQATLAWAAEHGAPAPRPLWILAGNGYGWMERADPCRLESRHAAAYFRRAGGLVCLARLLGASDLHAGNVVAGEDGPHLVDAETLIQPEGAVGPAPREAEGDAFEDTQLLVSTQLDARGAPYDFGGLTGSGGAVGERRRPVWRHPNRDGMTLETADAVLPEPRNRPLLEGRPASPLDFPEEVLAGYEATYRIAAAHARELLAPGGPLASAFGASTRIVLRPSQTYGVLLSRLRGAAYQVEGFLGDVLADSLNRVFQPFLDRPPAWSLARVEREALRNLDVPSFRIPVTADRFSGDAAEACFRRSGREALEERLTDLGEERLRTDLSHLRRRLSRSAIPAATERRGGAREELVEAALATADRLRRRAGEDPERWLLPDDCPEGAALSLDLYDGAVGTALFLATLTRICNRESDRELAAKAVAPVLEALEGRANEPRGLGACAGLGGIVYGLVGVGRALGEGAILDAAESAARRIETESLGTDRALEVSSGSAGALLGLLALYEHRPEPWLLERVVAARDRLAQAATPRPDGVAWATPAGPAHGGLAHGASGIALALARVAEATGDAASRNLALAGFRGEAMTEQVRRLGAELGFSWCHGVSGAGIARAVAHGLEPDADLEAAIDRASDATLQSGLSLLDHLCCGTGGRIELLLQVASVRSDESLSSAARVGASALLRRARRRPGFTLRSGAGDRSPYDPGLFRGLAGIGHLMLRAARPHEVPSILAFESQP